MGGKCSEVIDLTEPATVGAKRRHSDDLATDAHELGQLRKEARFRWEQRTNPDGDAGAGAQRKVAADMPHTAFQLQRVRGLNSNANR